VLKNRVSQEIEDAIVALATAFGQPLEASAFSDRGDNSCSDAITTVA
jgi:hypothetical protein